MEKKDLKNGMFVEFIDGRKAVLVNGTFVLQDGMWCSIDCFKNDLTNLEDDGFDIVRVFKGKCFSVTINLLWDRYEEKQEILDKEEKEYLSAVIKPFRNRVGYICKHIMGKYADIEFQLKKETYTTMLPYFEKDTMYKGMEDDKQYTLKELGL